MTTPDDRRSQESSVIHMDDRPPGPRVHDPDDEEGDPEVWGVLDKNFREVQAVLDRNRSLIQQVNDNHRSKIPDNMVKNVDLIRQINGNISKIVSLYSGLGEDFDSAFRRRRGLRPPKDGGCH